LRQSAARNSGRGAPRAFARAHGYDWLQFNGDPQHSGNNTKETAIHRNNVGRLMLKWQATLPALSDGAPVFLEAVSTPGGIKDVVYITTTNGYIVALDASTGSQLWSHQNGPGSCKINNNTSACHHRHHPRSIRTACSSIAMDWTGTFTSIRSAAARRF
jgi:glucose dehydrogenase